MRRRLPRPRRRWGAMGGSERRRRRPSCRRALSACWQRQGWRPTRGSGTSRAQQASSSSRVHRPAQQAPLPARVAVSIGAPANPKFCPLVCQCCCLHLLLWTPCSPPPAHRRHAAGFPAAASGGGAELHTGSNKTAGRGRIVPAGIPGPACEPAAAARPGALFTRPQPAGRRPGGTPERPAGRALLPAHRGEWRGHGTILVYDVLMGIFAEGLGHALPLSRPADSAEGSGDCRRRAFLLRCGSGCLARALRHLAADGGAADGGRAPAEPRTGHTLGDLRLGLALLWMLWPAGYAVYCSVCFFSLSLNGVCVC